MTSVLAETAVHNVAHGLGGRGRSGSDLSGDVSMPFSELLEITDAGTETPAPERCEPAQRTDLPERTRCETRPAPEHGPAKHADASRRGAKGTESSEDNEAQAPLEAGNTEQTPEAAFVGAVAAEKLAAVTAVLTDGSTAVETKVAADTGATETPVDLAVTTLISSAALTVETVAAPIPAVATAVAVPEAGDTEVAPALPEIAAAPTLDVRAIAPAGDASASAVDPEAAAVVAELPLHEFKALSDDGVAPGPSEEKPGAKAKTDIPVARVHTPEVARASIRPASEPEASSIDIPREEPRSEAVVRPVASERLADSVPAPVTTPTGESSRLPTDPTHHLTPAAPAITAGTPAASHLVHTPANPGGPALPIPIEGLAVEIAARAQAGKNHFQLRLDPPELGRIDVRLDLDREGNITSRLVVDRAETLDLLRREAPSLERAFQQAGLKTSDNGLQFSLRDHAFSHRQQDGQTPMARVVIPDETLTTLETQRNYGRAAVTRGGVDIRV